jgi:dephospho-CoA kinase
MFLIGLTGGIAAGKSTVAECWSDLGGTQIDADFLARKVVKPGSPGLAQVVQRFGAGVLDANGNLNRKILAQIVFEDASARKALEGILHPLVRAEASLELSKLPNDSMVIYNVPLLVEAAVDLPFDRVITVEAPEEDQIARMMQSRNMTQDEALARIKSQATPAQRANRADYILNSNQDLQGLLSDARALWRKLEIEAEQKQLREAAGEAIDGTN